MTERPKVGLGVIVVKDGKILMHKRKNAHGEGKWSLPGGHLEFNEEIEDGARREVMEEAGITIKNVRRATFTNDINMEEGNHYITIFLLADYDSGEVRVMEPHKCEKWEWFEWENMPQPLFSPIVNLLKMNYHPFK